MSLASMCALPALHGTGEQVQSGAGYEGAARCWWAVHGMQMQHARRQPHHHGGGFAHFMRAG